MPIVKSRLDKPSLLRMLLLGVGIAVLLFLQKENTLPVRKLAVTQPSSNAAPPGSQGNLLSIYEDWAQQEISFGSRSYYLAPWRSYMDTRTADTWNHVLGINFNVQASEADAAAQMLKEAGIRSARVEIGWNSLSYPDDSKLVPAQEKRLKAILSALKRKGIRPLILLNANSSQPAPHVQWEVKVSKKAKKGDRVIYLDNVSGIKPYYTGLDGLAYQTMYPVIVKIDAKTGKAELSAPLPKDVTTGRIQLTKLKYLPFSGTKFQNGQTNPAAKETLTGWLRYVAKVTHFVQDTLGTKGKADAGFDIEVWNEYTFGSQFSNIGNYYEPKPEFSEALTYKENGRTVEGIEVILPLTVNYIRNVHNGMSGVKVINGFSNQRPWDNGTEMWSGQTGFSRHYYTGYDPESSVVSRANSQLKTDGLLDALGNKDESGYTPTHTQAFPESTFYAYKTEYVTRDLQPFPGQFDDHFRFANPGDGVRAEVWMSETNFDRTSFTTQITNRSGLKKEDPKVVNLLHSLAAKADLRIYTFYGHKGIETVDLFAAKAEDSTYSFFPQAFYKKLAQTKGVLTDEARSLAGKQWNAVANVTRLMSEGKAIDNPRPIKVDEVVEAKPQITLRGDGTAAHPDLTGKDDLAILPYQLTENKYAIGFYMVTRDITKKWNPAKGDLDPSAYDMPEQSFKVTFSNVAGTGAKVYVYDPIQNRKLNAAVLNGSDTELTINLPTVDYPRFLVVEERGAGPLIGGPVLSRSKSEAGGATLSFTPNLSGEATVTWGAYPARTGGIFTEEHYDKGSQSNLLSKKEVGVIDYRHGLEEGEGIYKWSGTITPPVDGTYDFVVDADNCSPRLTINGETLLSSCSGETVVQKSLKAGSVYDLELTYEHSGEGENKVSLYWAPPGQPKTAVYPSPSADHQMVVQVVKGKKTVVQLPDVDEGEGVRIRFESKGLFGVFPQWDYDVKGGLWK